MLFTPAALSPASQASPALPQTPAPTPTPVQPGIALFRSPIQSRQATLAAAGRAGAAQNPAHRPGRTARAPRVGGHARTAAGNRLSITPVEEPEWQVVAELVKSDGDGRSQTASASLPAGPRVARGRRHMPRAGVPRGRQIDAPSNRRSPNSSRTGAMAMCISSTGRPRRSLAGWSAPLTTSLTSRPRRWPLICASALAMPSDHGSGRSSCPPSPAARARMGE